MAPRKSPGGTDRSPGNDAFNGPNQDLASAAPASDDAALLDALGRLAEALANPAQQAGLRSAVVAEATRLLAAEGAALCLNVPEITALRVTAATGPLLRTEADLLPAEGSFAGAALQTGAPVFTPDLAGDPHSYRALERGLPPAPALALPLASGGASALGVLLVVRAESAPPFEPAEIEVAARFAAFAAATLSAAEAFARTRRPEDELASWRAQRALEDQVERYARASWCQRAVVLEWNPTSGRIEWGDTVEAVFGYSPSAFGLTLDAWSRNLHVEDRPLVDEALASAAADGTQVRVACRVEHGFGGYRDVLLRCCGDPERGTVVGILAESDEEGGNRWGVRKGRFEAAREIIRALRHEINNPLSVVVGEAQLLRENSLEDLDPALRASVVAICDEGARIKELIRRLGVLEEAPLDSYLDESGGLNFPPE